MVYKGGRGTCSAENQVTPNTSQAAKGDNGNGHRYSLGKKNNPVFIDIYTLQRCPQHQRIFSKTSPSANEDIFNPSSLLFFLNEEESAVNQPHFFLYLHGGQKQRGCRSAPPPLQGETFPGAFTPASRALHAGSVGGLRGAKQGGGEQERASGQSGGGFLLPPASSSLLHNHAAAPSELPLTSLFADIQRVMFPSRLS